MGSIRLVYDAEGDILDMDFRLTGEKSRRGTELHDNVIIWTNAADTQILHITLLSYSRLLEQSALSFARLRKMPTRQRTSFLKLLMSDPTRRVLSCVDEEKLWFRVEEPGVREIAAA